MAAASKIALNCINVALPAAALAMAIIPFVVMPAAAHAGAKVVGASSAMAKSRTPTNS